VSKTERTYTVGERALVFIAAAADIPLDELNAVFAADAAHSGGTFRPVPESSYKIVRRAYAQHDPWAVRAWNNAKNPKPVGDL
jgi:hypothetical protein